MFDGLILGSGRSGTSMVAGSLRRAGYFMGEQLHPARDSNPLGFFEDAEVNGVNEQLLAPHVPAALGLGRNQLWLAELDRALELPIRRAPAERIAALTARTPFCFKDPRFSWTLPIWRNWIGAARFVCVFRDPAITASSIVRECASADYLRGVPCDEARALRIWRSIYRPILDDHRHQGDWLFLHYDQVVEGDGLERLGTFLRAPVDRAFPTPALRRSQARGEVDATSRAIYQQLCDLAGHRTARPVVSRPALEPIEPQAATAPAPATAPEISVLICTWRRKQTLLECLRSFDAQTLPPGQAELVVVVDGDDDGTADAVRALSLRTPLTLLARRDNHGLAAARSAALAASRGRLVLIVNDDTIAFPDLLERHVAAHADHAARTGKPVAILGTFEQPEEHLRTALMRVLERTSFVFDYVGLVPGVDLDGTRFWGCNVSAPRAEVVAAGAFDARFRRYGCEDTDLGLRLAARGLPVRYEPRARALHRHLLTFDDFASRQRAVARAIVHLAAKHPALLDHPVWRQLAALDATELARADESRAAGLARLADGAAQLAALDCSALVLAGKGEQAARIESALLAALRPLDRAWWAAGFLDGLRDLGLHRGTQLRAPPGDVEPWPLATTSRAPRLLAWPRWDSGEELEALLAIVADERIAAHRPVLVLRFDPGRDGPREAALARLEQASARTLPPGCDVEALLLEEALPAADLARVGAAVRCALLLPSSDAGERLRFFSRAGVPGARGADDLLAFLPERAAAPKQAQRAVPAAPRREPARWVELSV